MIARHHQARYELVVVDLDCVATSPLLMTLEK